ncbi:uncharacterized protein J4E84_009951 [Alternaria hordeiaustralica]|uniref:uncharacterized protein n=1 Tax=Alternaria hordeiaustralica TaxID=1187925 RepID=UPI0020C469F3|nr:uncharacterized protein J4E84_009951 [Alternaria hordeiaustralica]KAI4675798.1 hypothetical protein J4E84_009951 [Alternaria hordeiaustralica]
MDTSHRKIELQSPSDLTFLTSQIRTAARQKLDLHLPPVPSSATNGDAPDELRRSVEDLVEIFVAKVLQGIRQNVSINGIDVVESGDGEGMDGAVNGHGGGGGGGGGGEGESMVETVEYEPFDDKLRSQLSATVAKRDALIAKISQQRRTTPKVAAETWIKGFEEEERVWAALQESMAENAAAAGNGDGDVAGVEALQRQEEVERNWERAVTGLQRLNKGLPETRARLERAGDVVGYLGGGNGKK